MKGFPLMIGVLRSCKEPRTPAQVGEQLGVGYIPAVRMVAELRRAGLLETVVAPSGNRHGVYRLKGGEGVAVGRPLTRRFVRIWNEMLIPDTAAAIAENCGIQPNYLRQTIKALRKAGLAYRSGWLRNQAGGLPAALYAIGNRWDASRPKPLTEPELNQRANRKRRQARRVLLVASNPWQLACEQLRRSA